MRYLKNNREWQLHMIMALIGGYIGSYALLLRGGNFGSAMTCNFLEIMMTAAEKIVFGVGGITDILIRLGAVVVFGVSISVSHILKTRTKLPMQKVTLAAEAIAVPIAALMPQNMDPVLALYPIFFMSSFQWETFAGVKEFNCATIFSTNNFRQCVKGWTEYALSRQEKDRRKGSFYGLTILHFVTGGLTGALLTITVGPKCLFICLVFLAFAVTRTEASF